MFGYDVLELTDGTTTISFIDNRSYALVDGWAPQIATLRQSPLGGRGPYEDVIEELLVNVLGDTAANALANLAALTGLLDQATRWQRGDVVAPVRLRCQPNPCIIGTPVECVLTSRVDDRSAPVLPPVYDRTLGKYIFQGITISFRRAGLWLGPEESIALTTGPSGDVLSGTFTTPTDVPGPLRVQLEIPSTNMSTSSRHVLIVASEDTIGVVEGESLVGGGAYANATPGTNERGGSVKRYTAGTIFVQAEGAVPVAVQDCREIHVFAVVKPSSGTIYSAYLTFYGSIVATDLARPTPQVTIGDGSDIRARIVYLGSVSNMPGTGARLTTFALWLKAATASGTLDVDALYLVGAKKYEPSVVSIATFFGDATTRTWRLIADPNTLTLPAADAHMQETGGSTVHSPGWRGDASMQQTGRTVRFVWLGVRGDFFRYATSGPLTNGTPTLTARPAYLVPR